VFHDQPLCQPPSKQTITLGLDSSKRS